MGNSPWQCHSAGFSASVPSLHRGFNETTYAGSTCRLETLPVNFFFRARLLRTFSSSSSSVCFRFYYTGQAVLSKIQIDKKNELPLDLKKSSNKTKNPRLPHSFAPPPAQFSSIAYFCFSLSFSLACLLLYSRTSTRSQTTVI